MAAELYATQPASRFRVLVVEDDEGSREALVTLLRLQGCTVLTAADGAEAFAVASRELPHVVITDVCMPRLSGVELCGRLRQELSSPPQAIIALTALATDTWLEAAPASFDEVFSKPIDFNALAARVEAYSRFFLSRC